MISLIWPYWKRQEVADKSVALLSEHYKDLDFELIVVDDGSPEPYRAPVTPFPLRVLRLSAKLGPLNPCVPINRGVEISRGDVIALSGADILHTKPILRQMREELDDGDDRYVIAAVWHAEGKRWHCHSSYKRPDNGDVGSMLPPNADYHFMTMFHRSLWDRSGGFDEDYRDGAGYDDPDFVLRMNRVGARFVRRDDLVAEHVRSGAHAEWKSEMFERNRKLFMSKWNEAGR